MPRVARDNNPARIYVLLASRDMTAPQIIGSLKISTRCAYAALWQLEKMGMVRRLSGRPQSWHRLPLAEQQKARSKLEHTLQETGPKVG